MSGSPLARRLRTISALERREEARAFLRIFYTESGTSEAAFQKRWSEVRRELRRGDYYEQTPAELAFGARLAWRNHGRCIGRLYWESLEVVDCRNVVEIDALGFRLIDHIRESVSNGKVKSTISIFAPVRNEQFPSYIESPQLIQYAGYRQQNGGILGDRRNVVQTSTALELGWKSPEDRSRFDILPIILRDRYDRRRLLELPAESVLEVPIHHPTYSRLAELHLRWYAVPYVSNMILSIGGIEYPCAPFNGFYLCTEIASRNLVDEDRYDLLPEIGEAFELGPPLSSDQFWKDTALTELNRALVYSYRRAGVTITDHHTASRSFIDFLRCEQANGRHVAANWSWIVPPQASGALEVFDIPMNDHHPVPNYYRSRADDGMALMPYYGDCDRSKWQRQRDRVWRCWKLRQRKAQ